MSENLLEITKNIESLMFKLDAIEESGQAIPPELLDLVNMLVDKQADKIDASVSFFNYCEQQIEWLKKEKLKFDTHIKRYERAMTRLEYVAQKALVSQNLTELEGKVNKVALRKSEYVEIYDQAQLPQEYMRNKTIIEPDKDKIKRDLKNGLAVPGAVLKIRESVNFR